jgi:predicted ribosome quality control (RQC) complex YloA/Tae2 family protein
MRTLLFAAKLVIARSVAKHAGWAEVDYTLRKYVRKPRKAAPGSVLHTNAKTLHVEPEK